MLAERRHPVVAGRERHGASVIEVFVAVEILAIVVAVMLFAFGLGRDGNRVSCRDEVDDVQRALVAYRLEFGGNARSLGTLVSLKLLKASPGPESPSVAAGYRFDAARGTYTGGTCASS